MRQFELPSGSFFASSTGPAWVRRAPRLDRIEFRVERCTAQSRHHAFHPDCSCISLDPVQQCCTVSALAQRRCAAAALWLQCILRVRRHSLSDKPMCLTAFGDKKAHVHRTGTACARVGRSHRACSLRGPCLCVCLIPLV